MPTEEPDPPLSGLLQAVARASQTMAELHAWLDRPAAMGARESAVALVRAGRLVADVLLVGGVLLARVEPLVDRLERATDRLCVAVGVLAVLVALDLALRLLG